MANMVLINKVTVGSGGASSITFTGIPATYTDLVVKVSPRYSAASTNKTLVMRFNSDASTSNYKNRRIQGNGSTTSSSNEDGYNGGYVSEANADSSTASTFSNVEIYIPNYAGSNYKYFSVDSVMENNATTAYAMLLANYWSNTAAITSITLVEQSADTFVQYSTAYLYGVTNLTSTTKATGGTITSDGNYVYHTFLSSGTFTPTTSLTADYLVVAGGGGASGMSSGGGGGGGAGAGGYRTSIGGTALSLTATAYSVTVGAGGSGGSAGFNAGTKGSDSVFSTITSTGGGQTQVSTNNGGDGGSGGGSRVSTGAGQGNTPSTSPSQGNNGGITNGNGAAGGGGAGAIGENGRDNNGGAGGIGSNSATSFASATGTGVSGYYAGGGGGGGFGNSGGPGGIGGGGNGGNTTAGDNGVANTGGGGGSTGGSGGSARAGGSGGSGIVIVRYAV